MTNPNVPINQASHRVHEDRRTLERLVESLTFEADAAEANKLHLTAHYKREAVTSLQRILAAARLDFTAEYLQSALTADDVAAIEANYQAQLANA